MIQLYSDTRFRAVTFFICIKLFPVTNKEMFGNTLDLLKYIDIYT